MDRDLWHSEDIPTPIHARHDSEVQPRSNAEEPSPSKASPSAHARALQLSLLVTLIFIIFMVIFFYSSDIFVPVLGIGSLGLFVVSFLVCVDMYT